MEFLIPNGYLPSAALLKEYAESKLTKKFNTLPTIEYLNSKFDKIWQMSESAYELLRKRFNSCPPFIFYFNPDIQIREANDGYVLMLGFFDEDENRIGAGMYMWNDGEMYQGYFKTNYMHLHGRCISADGCIYEGGYHMHNKQGKGELEYIDGTKETGQWVGDMKQGGFECYDNNGRLTHRKVYQDHKEIRSEQVTEEI